MDASRRGSQHLNLHIELTRQPIPADGKALPHGHPGSSASCPHWKPHVIALATGVASALATWAAAANQENEQQAAKASIAGLVGIPAGYALQYVIPRLRSICARWQARMGQPTPARPLASAADAGLPPEQAWQALLQDLPEEAGAQADGLIARLALARPCPEWMLLRALDHFRDLNDITQGGQPYEAYIRQLTRLVGAVGADFDETRLGSWVVNAMWSASARGAEGVAQRLLDSLPGVVDAFGWQLTLDHVIGLVGAMTSTGFFGTDPGPRGAAGHVLALVRPCMKPTQRRFLVELLKMRWDVAQSQSMTACLGRAAILPLLRDMPAAMLGEELPTAMEHLLVDGHALAAARGCLAAMDVLAQRPAEPGFPSLLGGIVEPGYVSALIEEIAEEASGDGNVDRAGVIARLPQLCQQSTSPDLVRMAARAIRSLPELQADDGDASSARPSPSGSLALEALKLVLQACSSPTLFISRSDESAKANADAGHEPALRAESAVIEHPWLTASFISEMTAPLMEQRESKHG